MRLIRRLLICFFIFTVFFQFDIVEAKESKLRIETVSYSADLQADLFSMPSVKKVPAVILVHGGYWLHGDRKEMSDFATKLVQNGFLVMSIDYHLLPKYSQQSQTKDIINAICWLKANSKNLGINPNKIGVVGVSAGGYLAAWAATHDEVINGVHSLPNAVVSLYGPWDLTKEAEKELSSESTQLVEVVEKFCAGQNRKTLSPIFAISKNTPPVLLVHGDEDKIVPVSQSVKAYEKLKENDCKCKLVIVPNFGHCSLNTKSSFQAIDISTEFLNKVLK